MGTVADQNRPTTWERLPDAVRRALAAGWRQGVPSEATALYARWWQLERWLRDVVYVELRAQHGVTWSDVLPPLAGRREEGDRKQRHMQSPDAHARLAYLDTGPLFDLLDAQWPLVQHALLDDQAVWQGRVIELRKIRNRIGHCRRPHPDDLARLEQTLRDLDSAAFETVAAYNRQREPQQKLNDPVVEAWVRTSHQDAMRLVDHAGSNHDVGFALRYSRRPWAAPRAAAAPVSGTPGYLWHVSWYLGRTELRPRRLWADNRLDPYRDLVVFVGFNDRSAVEVSFAAVDDPDRIADAIGAFFDAVLVNDSQQRDSDLATVTEDYERWIATNSDLDTRVQVATEWTVVDGTTTPITMFNA